MKKYKFEIDINDNGEFTIDVLHGKKLNSFKFKGKLPLLEDEEVIYSALELNLKRLVSDLILNGMVTDYTLSGNLGANK
jgi:hypothetical protein